MPRKSRNIPECECGNLKRTPQMQACERCLFLDGNHIANRELIHEMRMVAAPVTQKYLALALNKDYSSVLRMLRRLESAGRAKRMENMYYEFERFQEDSDSQYYWVLIDG